MAHRKGADSWVWKHLLKLNDSTVQCNVDNCYKTYQISHSGGILRIKTHLYHKHKKFDEEDRLKWENNDDLIWRYFDKGDLYEGKCTFCEKLYHEGYLPFLRKHLQKFHIQDIRDKIQQKIADQLLSQYYEIHMEDFSARCKRCNVKMNIFYGVDALRHHICSKKNESLRSRQEPEDNGVNRMTQQSIDNENPSTSSHHDNINTQAPGNRENQESNTTQYYWNLMAAEDRSDDWMLEHLEVDNLNIQCNITNCDQTYSIKKYTKGTMTRIKAHLYNKHDISHETDRSKWESDNHLIWQYYYKVDLYKERCKFCKKTYHEPYIPRLRSHLQAKHSQRIRDAIQKEIKDKSLSQYYEIHEKEFSARCKRCNVQMDIFYGADALRHHICLKIKESLISRQEPEDIGVNRITQRSIDNENPNTSSHHDNMNTQAPGNRENQQSNITRFYWNLMTAEDRANDWMWEHLKFDNLNVQCNITNCGKTYKTTKIHKKEIMTKIKGHLYHKHDICHETERSKWESDNDLIWQYFDKVDLYKERCTFCEKIFHESYIPCLKSHLRQNHNQRIRDVVQGEIADKSLSQYYEIHEEEFSAWCKSCNVKMDIFYGVDALMNHNCTKKNQSLRTREEPEDNDVNRMMQQSIDDENTSTSSNHDNINTQAPGNQQSSDGNNMDGNGIEQFLFHDVSGVSFRHDLSISELFDHICNDKIQSLTSREEPEDNNVNRMMQQSIDDENTSTSSNHDNINTQAPGNQENQQSSEGNNMDGMDQFLFHDVSGISFRHDCSISKLLDIE